MPAAHCMNSALPQQVTSWGLIWLQMRNMTGHFLSFSLLRCVVAVANPHCSNIDECVVLCGGKMLSGPDSRLRMLQRLNFPDNKVHHIAQCLP